VFKLGNLARKVGDQREALRWYREELEIDRQLSEDDDDDDARRQTLSSYAKMAALHLQLSERPEATALRREAVLLRRQLGDFNSENPDTLNAAAWAVFETLDLVADGLSADDTDLLATGVDAARRAVALQPSPAIVDTLAALLELSARHASDDVRRGLEEDALALRRRAAADDPSRYRGALEDALRQLAARREGAEARALTEEADALHTDSPGA
jgi:tetratricopeptide (TPR) repeat protein